MIFNSLTFLLYFLPISIIAYCVCPSKYKNVALLILSIIFYILSDIKSIPIIALVIVVNYFYGEFYNAYRATHTRYDIFFYVIIVWNVLLLLFFKYNRLPLGFSFIIFNILSYHIDMYREKTLRVNNLLTFSIYILFFGKTLQGPLVRFGEWELLLINRNIDIHKIGKGIETFIKGLAVKCIICTNIMLCLNYIDSVNYSYISLVLHEVLFVIYLYLDFQSYTTMAMGVATIFGFTLPKNFDYPLCATSLTSFWRRWHMTLSFWFRDYIYIPLGGNRCGKTRAIFNILIVWILTGIWHGLTFNFLWWGMLNFLFLVIEKYVFKDKIKKIKVLNHIWTIVVVVLIFISFEYTDAKDYIATYSCIFFIRHIDMYNAYVLSILSNYIIWIILAILLSTPIVDKAYVYIKKRSNIAMIIINIIALIISISYIVSSSYSPFMYIKF